MNDSAIHTQDFHNPKEVKVAPSIRSTVQPERPIVNDPNKWIQYIHNLVYLISKYKDKA